MLASSAMCAILSFNQPTLRSFDNIELVYRTTQLTEKSIQIETHETQQIEHQLELALTLELLADEQIKALTTKNKLNNKKNIDHKECDNSSKRSVETKYSKPQVRNTHSI